MKHVTIWAAAMLLLASGCNRQPGNNAASRGEGNGAAANVARAEQAEAERRAAEADIRALLDQIYAPYASDNAPGREISGFMEPALADAMRHSEDGPDADPFIDAQDYEPFRPNVVSIRVTGASAEAAVRINSLGERTINYRFVRTAGGWKIADIRGPDGGSLRAQYKLSPLP